MSSTSQLKNIQKEKHQQFIENEKENIEVSQHSTDSISNAIHLNGKETPANTIEQQQ